MYKKINFNECPRPQFVRSDFTILDGKWDFRFDKNNEGEANRFYDGFTKEYDIVVPFSYQTKASGINIQDRCDFVWYQKIINVKKENNFNYFLHFEGSDYKTTVFVNGKLAGKAEGCYHRLSFSIGDLLVSGDNKIVVKCEDDYSIEKPRGKQRYKDQNFECWYVDTTGIYKSVWLEKVPTSYVKNVKITPNVKDKKVCLEYAVSNANKMELKSTVLFEGNVVNSLCCTIENNELNIELDLSNNIKLWDLEIPNLYDLKIELLDGDKVVDRVDSYFGLRECISKDGFIYLNGKKLYQKLVLDQGYFIDSHLTAPSLKALYEDITKMKELGFNGCRKHQKQEDERFVYYADVLGYLLWSEMPSMYSNTLKSRQTFETEWIEVVKQNYNHPCIIVWTPFNESWGIKDVLTNKVEQSWIDYIYYVTKAIDPNRFVITNDGWEHTISDIITIHHYEQDGEKLYSYYDTKEKALADVWQGHHKGAFAKGYSYKDQPIMFTEFGGTAHQSRTKDTSEGIQNWGYGQGVNDDNDYVNRLSGLFGALNKLEYSSGYCYTQLSDVQQEINGILYENRSFKVDPKLIKNIQDQRN